MGPGEDVESRSIRCRNTVLGQGGKKQGSEAKLPEKAGFSVVSCVTSKSLHAPSLNVLTRDWG